MFPDCVSVVLFSVFSVCVTSVLEYVLIHRGKEESSGNNSSEKEKDVVGSSSKRAAKRESRLEKAESTQKSEMAVSRMKSMVAMALTLFTAYQLLNSQFDGKAVAKLPFTPIDFFMIRSLTHRNLPGTDFTECSSLFLFALTSMALRSNVQKFFGWSAPQFNIFEMPKQQ